MKRIIAILILLVNMLLFYNVREVFIERDTADMLQIHRVSPDIVHASLIINNRNNMSISDETSEAIFDMFIHLTQKFDLLIMNGEANFERNEYITYLIASMPIDERLELVTNTSLDFKYERNYFYTNQRNVENGVNFFLLNRRATFNFLPITAMGTIRGGEYTFVARSQEELDESISIFMTQFGEYVSQIIEFDSDPFDFQEAIESFLTPVILVAMLIIALVIIMYIHIHAKKIAVLKTMGITFFHIAKQLFVPLVLIITLSIVVINTVLFTLLVGALNARTLPMVWTLLQSGVMQLIAVIVTILVSTLLLLFVPIYSLLKNSNLNRFLMGANYVLKIIVLVVMIPFLSGRLDMIQDNFRMISYVRHYEQNGLFSEYQFSPMLNPRYRGDGYFAAIMEITGTADWDSIDSEMLYEYDVLYEYQRAFRILNEAGAIFSQGSSGMGGVPPGLVVNENYLAKHLVRDVYGHYVDLSHSVSEIIYLIPEMYLGSGYVENLISLDYEIVIIKNDQVLFDYSLLWDFTGIPTQPYTLRVFRDNSFRLEASPLTFVFVDGDINALLRDTSFYNRILVSSIENELNRIRERHTQEIVEHILVMAPTFALILVIILQYSYLYSKVYKKRIYAKKIMGHSPFKTFLPLLIESSLAVVAAISIVWYLQLDIRLLLMVLIMEIAVYLAVVAASAWKHSTAYDYYN